MDITPAFRLWDAWERSDRIRELERLQSSQWLSAAELTTLQLQRLADVVARAWRDVPFYGRVWPRSPDISSLADLRSVPILTKAAVRGAGTDLLSRSFQPSQLLGSKTGGSTGTSLQLWFSFGTQQRRNAAAMRSDGWAGWRPGYWTGALWGNPHYPRTWRARLRNALRDRIVYLDTMRMDETSMTTFLAELRRRQPAALFGHAHSLFILAEFVRARQLEAPPVRGIVSTSMMLLEHERRAIETAFGCPVYDRYGCEEVGLIAAECDRHLGLHVNAEHVVVEIVRDDGAPAAPGEVGRVIVTDLVNPAMPLIRYEVGDLASWAIDSCSCGRGAPMIAGITGRIADAFVREDGSLIAGVSLVERTLTAIPGLAQLQLVQHSPSRLTANVVPDAAYVARSGDLLREELVRAFGHPLQIDVRVLASLPIERNGKYRFAIRENFT